MGKLKRVWRWLDNRLGLVEYIMPRSSQHPVPAKRELVVRLWAAQHWSPSSSRSSPASRWPSPMSQLRTAPTRRLEFITNRAGSGTSSAASTTGAPRRWLC